MFLKIYPVNYVEDRWNWSKRRKRNLEMRETTGTWKARRYRHWGGLWIVTLVGREESREPLIQRNDLKALGKWKRICLPERGCSEFVCLYVKELFYSLRICAQKRSSTDSWIYLNPEGTLEHTSHISFTFKINREQKIHKKAFIVNIIIKIRANVYKLSIMC